MKKTLCFLILVALIFSPAANPLSVNVAQAAMSWKNIAYEPYDGPNAIVSCDPEMSVQSQNDMSIDVFCGEIHIAWSDKIGGLDQFDIFYVRWDRSLERWVNYKGVVYNGTNANVSDTNLGPRHDSIDPSLVVDKEGHPHICWVDNQWGNNYEMVYVHQISYNGDWMTDNHITYAHQATCRILQFGQADSFNPCMKIDATDLPHITFSKDYYFRGRNQLSEIWFGRQTTDGTQSWEEFDGTAWGPNVRSVSQTPGYLSEFPSLHLDSNNAPHISWQDLYFEPQYEICYVHSDGTNWLNAEDNIWPNNSPNVSQNDGVSIRSSIEIDSSDNPHIAWSDDNDGNFDIYYVRWNGSTSTWEDVEGGAYPGGSAYNITVNDGSSLTPSLELAYFTDFPHVAWSDDTWGDEDIYCMQWDGSDNWVSSEDLVSMYNPTSTTKLGTNVCVSNNDGLSQLPCLVVDKYNYSRLSWQDDSYGCNEDDPNWEILYVALSPSFDFEDEGGFVTLTKAVEADGSGEFDDDGEPVPPGVELEYRLRWSIYNPDPASYRFYDSYLTDRIPMGSSYIPFSANPPLHSYSIDGGVTWILGDPGAPLAGGSVIRWFINSNSSQDFYFRVLLDPPPFDMAYSPVCNRAIYRNDFNCKPLFSANSNTVCNSIGEIGFTKIASKTDYDYNEDIIFTLRVNTKFGDAHNIVVTDTFPPEFVFISASEDVTVVGNTITWFVGDMAQGEVKTLTLTFRLNENYVFPPYPVTFRNNAVLVCDEYPPVYAFADVTLHKMDITIEKTVNRTEFTREDLLRDGIVYHITVRNQGTEPITNVVITDQFPAELIFLSSDPPPDEIAGTTMRWFLPILLPGEIFEIDLRFTMNIDKLAGVGNLLFKNIATLTADEIDPIEDEADFTVLRSKLAIRKYSKSMFHKPTDLIKFYIEVENVGGDIAKDVNIYDFFPRELEFVSARPSNPGGASKVWYIIGDLKPGEKIVIELTFRLKNPDKIPQTSNLVITNKSKLSAKGYEDMYAYASIIIAFNTRRELYLNVVWKGIDTKKSIGKVNEEIELEITCHDGAAPFMVTVDFGDGSEKILYEAPNENPHFVKHTYTTPGEYKVVISCDDAFGLNKKVRRTITVE